MKDCTTCKYGYEDERLGIQMCHHPKRFSEDCVDFNMHEEKEKPVPNDLEEAADNHIREVVDAAGHPGWEWETRDIKEAFIAGAEWQAKCMKDEEEKELSEKIAAAYQLGIKDKEQKSMEGLDEVAKAYALDTAEDSEQYSARYLGYKDGAKWQKQEMLKEAVEGTVVDAGFDKPEQYETFTATNDLEEAAKKYAHCPYTDDDGNFYEDAIDGTAYRDFIAGAKWQKEQKPTWSEEDEEMLEYVIGDVNEAKQLFATKKDAIDLCDKEIAWLKSLRPSWTGRG